MPICLECSTIEGISVRGTCEGGSCDNCGSPVKWIPDVALFIIADLKKEVALYQDQAGAIGDFARSKLEKYEGVREMIKNKQITRIEEFYGHVHAN